MGQQSRFSGPICERCGASVALWTVLDTGEAMCVVCGANYALDSTAPVSKDGATFLDEVCDVVMVELGLQPLGRRGQGWLKERRVSKGASRRERCLDRRLRHRAPKIAAWEARRQERPQLFIDLPVGLGVRRRPN